MIDNSIQQKLKETSILSYSNSLLFYLRNNYKESLNLLNESIKYNDDNWIYYYNRSILHGLLGNINNQIDDAVKAIQLNEECRDLFKKYKNKYIFIEEYMMFTFKDTNVTNEESKKVMDFIYKYTDKLIYGTLNKND